MEVCRPANHCLIGAACTYWSLEGVHMPQWPRQDGIGRGKRFNETLILDTINACTCRLAFSSKSSSIFTNQNQDTTCIPAVFHHHHGYFRAVYVEPCLLPSFPPSIDTRVPSLFFYLTLSSRLVHFFDVYASPPFLPPSIHPSSCPQADPLRHRR